MRWQPLRMVAIASVLSGMAWLTAGIVATVGDIVTDDVPATPSRPCPVCETEPLVNIFLGAAYTGVALMVVVVLTMRLVLLRKGPPGPKRATTLLAVGVLLLAAYGLGVLVLIPALVYLWVTGDEVPWVSRKAVMLMVIGMALAVPFLFLADAAALIALASAICFGVAWIWFGVFAWATTGSSG